MQVFDEVDRVEDAVEGACNVGDDRAERERDEQRVPADEPQALEDFLTDVRGRRPSWTRRLGVPDQAERNRRDAEGDRVDEDREWCADELHEAARQPRTADLRERRARGQLAVALEDPINPNQRRDVSRVGGIEERPETAREE